MVATVLCKAESARCLGQCLEPSGSEPESAASLTPGFCSRDSPCFPLHGEHPERTDVCKSIREDVILY